jgi:hypothetical protein
LGDAPEATPLNELDGIAKVAPAALLHAALKYLLAGADRTGEGGAFFQGVRDRFFKINIFAGCQGVDRHAHMPVVGRGDKDGVDLLLEDFVKIQVGARDSVGAFLDGVAARRINVAHRDDLIAAGLVGRIEQVAHTAACSDNSDAQSVVGAKHSA